MKETKFGSGSGFIREETNSNIVCDVYLFGSFYLFVCLLRFSYKYQIFLNVQPFTLVGRHGIMVFLLKTSRGTEFLPSQRDDKASVPHFPLRVPSRIISLRTADVFPVVASPLSLRKIVFSSAGETRN